MLRSLGLSRPGGRRSPPTPSGVRKTLCSLRWVGAGLGAGPWCGGRAVRSGSGPSGRGLAGSPAGGLADIPRGPRDAPLSRALSAGWARVSSDTFRGPKDAPLSPPGGRGARVWVPGRGVVVALSRLAPGLRGEVLPVPQPGGPPPDTPRGPRDAPLSRALSAGWGPLRFARERPPLDPPGPPGGRVWVPSPGVVVVSRSRCGRRVGVREDHGCFEGTVSREVALVPFLARCARERNAMVGGGSGWLLGLSWPGGCGSGWWVGVIARAVSVEGGRVWVPGRGVMLALAEGAVRPQQRRVLCTRSPEGALRPEVPTPAVVCASVHNTMQAPPTMVSAPIVAQE